MTKQDKVYSVRLSLDPRFHPANLPMAEEVLRETAGRFRDGKLSRRSSHRFEMVVQEGEWRRNREILRRLVEEYGEIFTVEEKIG